MRVGFDVSALARPHSPGIQRVTASLVAALERRGALEVVRLAAPPGASLRRWRQTELPRLARGLVGLHSFTSGFALRGPGARVQTIHELPWRHGVQENSDLFHRLWASLGTLRASRIVCPSEHVARDLPGFARRKTRVVPWGVDERFRAEPAPGEVDEVVLTRYRLGDEPFVFCPGAVRPKKNLAAVLRALAERRRRGTRALRLLVSGGDSAQLRRDLGLASRLGLDRAVMVLEHVAEEDLPALYRLSKAVPVLSRSEGFALPVLEALASATPVLVPPESAQAEVAGEAGLRVDPQDPGAVADGLERALEQRGTLGALGVARARSFGWDSAAERVERLWQELA
jgi:glycosyltransferase involved in cell wall biosynthesis